MTWRFNDRNWWQTAEFHLELRQLLREEHQRADEPEGDEDEDEDEVS